jgi:hypothetical protein
VHRPRVGAGVRLFVLALAATAVLSGALPARAADPGLISQVVRGYRQVQGRLVEDEIILAAPNGSNATAVAAHLLSAIHASPKPSSNLFLAPQWVWPQFFDASSRNDQLTQYYNPAGDPTGGSGLNALQRSQATWSRVPGSSFRFALGGTTTRCPSSSPVDCTGVLRDLASRIDDGFNDIAWVPLAKLQDVLCDGCVIFSLLSISFPDGPYLASEFDWLINTDISPLAWSTDGTHLVDLESRMLRSEGSAMGLGAAFDPNAVLYYGNPDLNGGPILRTLSATDENAVRSSYPATPTRLADAAASHDIALVAEESGPAPGGGVFINDFEAGAANSQGDVAFVSDLSDGHSGFLGEGLFVESGGGGTKQIVREGSQFAGVELGQFALDAVGLNDAGDVAFCWLLGPLEAPFGVNGGLFRSRASGLGGVALMLPGITPAPGGGVFVGCHTATISNDGDIAFTGLVQRAESESPIEGAFLAQRDGTIVRVAGPGDAAPGGGTYSSAAFPRISPTGRNVAFVATIEGVSGSGVYLRKVSGSIKAIAVPGDPAAGGGEIMSAIQPSVNSDGRVLYAADVPGPSGEPSLSLFLTDRSGTSLAIARAGDLLPDGFRFDALVSSLSSWTLNDLGDVAFVANAESQPIPARDITSVLDTAVYATSHGQMRFIARGDRLGECCVNGYVSGLGVLQSVAPVPSPALIDGRGDVVFGAQVVSPARMIVLLRAGPEASVP